MAQYLGTWGVGFAAGASAKRAVGIKIIETRRNAGFFIGRLSRPKSIALALNGSAAGLAFGTFAGAGHGVNPSPAGHHQTRQ